VVQPQRGTAAGHSIADLAEMFSVSRPTVYRVLARAAAAAPPAIKINS
jgi:transposase